MLVTARALLFALAVSGAAIAAPTGQKAKCHVRSPAETLPLRPPPRPPLTDPCRHAAAADDGSYVYGKPANKPTATPSATPVPTGVYGPDAKIASTTVAGTAAPTATASAIPEPVVAPACPAAPAFVDTAAPNANALAFVDTSATNQRNDACLVTLDTNAGVRVVAGFLDIWKPSSLIVDAGVTLPAKGSCPAVVASPWTGIPGDATDGTVLNKNLHDHNLGYVIAVTNNRTVERGNLAYFDDRRNKAYSVSDAFGPLTAAWRAAAQQNTTIVDIPADATTKKYDDAGNDVGVGSDKNPLFGLAVDFVGRIGENGSTEPAKRFYKYARPYRWTKDVKVLPTLEPAKAAAAGTDGGFISGHSAEGVRRAIAMAYLVPQRFQELMYRALELGESRAVAGMHNAFDIIGGRMHATAVATASIAAGGNKGLGPAAYAQAQKVLMAATNTTTFAELLAVAKSGGDRFDYDTIKPRVMPLLTFDFPATRATNLPAVVPKGAEVLLETRFPYLSADQRRVVLKTTALPSGFPVTDDAEGWGRINLFAAADGFGAFNGDVIVTMDAAQDSFAAADAWRNDISGTGRFTKAGSGALTLGGKNTYTGGSIVTGGALIAASPSAFGTGSVCLSAGRVAVASATALAIGGDFTVSANTVVEVAKASTIAVSGAATLLGGELVVKVAAAAKAGDVKVAGKFDKVTVAGFAGASAKYTATAIEVTLA
ncbi:hypothetical protein BC831DRAFT_462732 [Entophlyctis helioformis]|nr:hypothetical protein BC831DRAFT_462732 [Entophlyctis helioformis]